LEGRFLFVATARIRASSGSGVTDTSFQNRNADTDRMLAYGKSKKEKIKAAFSSVVQMIEKSRADFFEWKLELENPFNQVHFPHVERVGILQSNPALYTYMIAETGLTVTSARENSHDAYAEYIGELSIFSHTKDMEQLIDY
jgi:hypothetical protein